MRTRCEEKVRPVICNFVTMESQRLDIRSDGMGSLDGRKTGAGKIYRVLLVDSERHTEKLVNKAIPLVIPEVDESRARRHCLCCFDV